MKKLKPQEQTKTSEACSTGFVLPELDLSKSKSVLKSLDEAIKKNNTEFANLSKNKQRVAIARDVIASLRKGLYKAEAGTYLLMEDTTKSGNEYVRTSIVNLEKEGVVCEVCAIGSMFVSSIKKTGAKAMTDSDNKMIRSLSYVYTKKELRTLEMCFEGSDINATFEDCDEDDKDFQLSKDAKSFYKENGGYRQDERRLMAIMENIIENKGNFIYKSINI